MIRMIGRLSGVALVGVSAWLFYNDVHASIAAGRPAFQTLADLVSAAPALWLWACAAGLGVLLLTSSKRPKRDRFSPKRP